MCGIAGHISKKKIDRQECLLMSEAIKHRGPDDHGDYFEEKLYLGHRRLSIIDLTDSGHQPMWDSEKEVCITFNGEIYNFKEIKKELSEYNFVSTSDTEVLIYAYKKWGFVNSLKRLNGMFSFVVYDKKNQKCFFARDRVGIKPFVYYYDNDNFIFASELKSLLKNKIIDKKINKKSLTEYFLHRYIPNPNTIIDGVNKLEPGHYMTLDIKSFKLDKNKYWALDPKKYSTLTKKEIINKAEILIKQSVKYRLIADTEVATFLSGGIDSSLISSLAKKINPKIRAFTIDIKPDQYSELNYAIAAAKHSNIELIATKIDSESFKNNFDDLISYFDEPFADSSLVPTYLLTKTVSETGIKCALSGDGGDEVFYGYSWYKTFDKLKQSEKILKLLPKRLAVTIIKKLKNKILLLAFLSSFEQYRKIIYNRFSINELKELFDIDTKLKEEDLFRKKVSKKDLNRMDLAYLDFQTFLTDDILYKVDIASMASSLEVRTPFLDHNLVEFMFSVSYNYLYKKKTLKYILKKLSEGYLNNKNIYRKKKGFSAPVMEWISKDFKNDLLTGSLIKSGFISEVKMESFLNKETNLGKLWQMYIFEKWFSNYMI